MDVNVGSMADPDDIPGLAHFLEHLLFLGTAKYPMEDDYGKVCHFYRKFVSTSASTLGTPMRLRAKITPITTSRSPRNIFMGHLGLQFFVAPLFNPDGVDREMRAVDSEHKKNIQNDAWRMMQISRTASNPNHPYSKFATGCLETLSGKSEIRDGVHRIPRSILLCKSDTSGRLWQGIIGPTGGMDDRIILGRSQQAG